MWKVRNIRTKRTDSLNPADKADTNENVGDKNTGDKGRPHYRRSLCAEPIIFEDPLRDGRRGTALLPTLLKLTTVICATLCLAINDCKTVFGASADVIGKGIARLLDQIATYAPGLKVL